MSSRPAQSPREKGGSGTSAVKTAGIRAPMEAVFPSGVEAAREAAGQVAGDEEGEAGPAGALLQYLDQRQNQVLAELDQLSTRIESLISQLQQDRDASRVA